MYLLRVLKIVLMPCICVLLCTASQQTCPGHHAMSTTEARTTTSRPRHTPPTYVLRQQLKATPTLRQRHGLPNAAAASDATNEVTTTTSGAPTYIKSQVEKACTARRALRTTSLRLVHKYIMKTNNTNNNISPQFL